MRTRVIPSLQRTHPRQRVAGNRRREIARLQRKSLVTFGQHMIGNDDDLHIMNDHARETPAHLADRLATAAKTLRNLPERLSLTPQQSRGVDLVGGEWTAGHAALA